MGSGTAHWWSQWNNFIKYDIRSPVSSYCVLFVSLHLLQEWFWRIMALAGRSIVALPWWRWGTSVWGRIPWRRGSMESYNTSLRHWKRALVRHPWVCIVQIRTAGLTVQWQWPLSTTNILLTSINKYKMYLDQMFILISVFFIAM